MSVDPAIILRAMGEARAIPRRLAALRRAKGIGPTQLATDLGRTRQTLYRWEHGQTVPSAEELWCWAAALGISLGEVGSVTDPVTQAPGGAP